MERKSHKISHSNGKWKEWFYDIDHVSLLALIALIFFGLVMTITASTAVAERIHTSHFHFVWRQMVFILFAIPLMLIISIIPEKNLYRIGLLGFLFTVLLLLLLPHLGEEIKGSKRWLNILGFSLQPSELIKPLYVIVTGVILGEMEKTKKLLGFMICCALHCFICFLLIIQPDLGMTITVSIVTVTQMFIAGLPWLAIVMLSISLAVGSIIAYFTFPHVTQRISTFLNGAGGKTTGYQMQQSLESYINGGIFGRGPGEGNTKYLLPDSHTDFIFAVAGEEFGSIFCLMIISIIAFIVIRGITNIIALSKTNNHQAAKIYIAVGALMYFAFQSIFNIGVTLHIFPTKGMTLPFISYGGSAMLSSAIGMGAYFNVMRKKNKIDQKMRKPFMKLM